MLFFQASSENSASSDFHVKCSNTASEYDRCVGRNEKQCACDILPPKRHRHAHSSDVSGQRAGADPLTDSNEAKTSSGAATWRPTVRSSSVWRSVAGHALKQTSGRTVAVPVELSPLPVRQSMSSERSTPSESPSPRPASASSGFFDSSQGSLNCNVGDGFNGLMFSYTFAQSYREALEERISSDTTNSLLDTTAVASSESLPMICAAGSGRGTPPVSPFSAEALLPVRCRSQPTVLARNRRDRTRAMGKKRRWPVCDDHRPKLDFLKMKEVSSYGNCLLKKLV
jgi:hypothetical protein